MSSFCRKWRWTKPLPFLIALLLAAAAPAPGDATTVVRLDDGELVDRAELIVTGECVGNASARVGGRIVTLATVRVTELLHGDPGTGVAAGSRITVVLPGGVDRSGPVPLAEVWPGAPELAPSENVLVFLHSFSRLPAAWSIVGYSQGKFTLMPAAAGGALEARRDLTGVTLVGDAPSAETGTARGEPLAYWRRLVAVVRGSGETR